MTRAQASQSATNPLDETLVLHKRPLRAGATLEGTSRFRDDRWDLTPAVLQRHLRALQLNFETIPHPYRLVTKELCYAMLTGEFLPSGEARPEINTVRSTFTGLKHMLTWLDTRPPPLGRPARPQLSELTGADLQDYQRYLLATFPSPSRRQVLRASVRYFWRYRNCLTSDRLQFDPLHVEDWSEYYRRSSHSRENVTDRIPESVHGPLLAWSLRFVNDFADDILRADQCWRTFRDHESGIRAPRLWVQQSITDLLDDYIRNRRPLPGHNGKPHLSFLSAQMGAERHQAGRYRAEIAAAIAVVGLARDTCFDIEITGRLDGEAWIHGISLNHIDQHGLARLARMLQSACYVTVAFLSGMRDSEIKHLRRGCLSVERDDQGCAFRWKATSLAFKGEEDSSGVEATWVIGQPAARAIQLLEQLHPPTTEFLFSALPHSPGKGPAMKAGPRPLASSTTNRQLNHLVEWINTYCADHARHDRIPLVDNKPWRLCGSQFRRTLAWFVARRPGGVIAGAIAYRHHSVQMFEGYAGTSDSGFRAEVESEQALARGEHLLEMIDAHEHDDLAGPAADEAARRLEAFGAQSLFQGKVVTDERRLERLMKRHDPAIYPDKYVTCVHTHATALCLQRRDSRSQLRPDLGSCQPLACANVALTQGNRTALRAELTRLDSEVVAIPALPPLLRRQLQDRRDDIAVFLTRHSPGDL
ncbi:hypothetical protein ACFXPS_17905 [Nocardia sp. NPDC059091]|uniref:hypothetical protein n=1 Tax=Nocardia sp. NPDC059091 TaxID=3346724 RepID=UPI0036816753